jgi:hypothetical protein
MAGIAFEFVRIEHGVRDCCLWPRVEERDFYIGCFGLSGSAHGTCDARQGSKQSDSTGEHHGVPRGLKLTIIESSFPVIIRECR